MEEDSTIVEEDVFNSANSLPQMDPSFENLSEYSPFKTN